MIEITAFKTSDDKIFEDKESAKEHEKNLQVHTVIKEIITEGLQGLYVEEEVVDQMAVVLSQKPKYIIERLQKALRLEAFN